MGSETRPRRFIWLAGLSVVLLVAAPVSFSATLRGGLFSLMRFPLSLSSAVARTVDDLLHFRRNADESRAWRQMRSKDEMDIIRSREILAENDRLAKLLELKPSAARGTEKVLYARVIARSPLAWNGTFWIDKGFADGMRENMPVFTGEALIGKILEVLPGASKVLLLTDPNCKIGVMVQRTREQGVMFGVLSGECRMKYLSVDADVKPGDRVETAGLGVFFPKGIPAGTVTKVWKEPGQIYKVAQVKPLAELSKIEEVAVIDVR